MTTTSENTPPTAAEIMHSGCRCIAHTASAHEAAQLMKEQDVGALPVCGPDDRLVGMLTDRDIVLRCLSVGADPTTCQVARICTMPVVWVRATAPVRDVLSIMEERQLRRLPVIGDDKRLVGIISEKDICSHLSHERAGELLERVCSG